MRERPVFERPSFELRVRGSFSAKGERVYAGTPRALHPMRDDQPSNRLGLARWLVDPNNPLVARVVVNRLWEQLFGRGLVETSEDFGSQGAPPTHPELLDWLATELVAKGWSQKTLIKTMVMSATYRQSSAVPAAVAERDPYNRLFARGPRVRMEAEMIRDATLAASGLLSDKMFGPSVFPMQPDGIWNQPYSSDKWAVEQRRGSLPPQPVYVLAADVAVSELHDLRRDQPRVLHGAPRPHQHAAAGADAAERSGAVRGGAGAGAADGRGRQHAGRARRMGRQAGAVASGGARGGRPAGGGVREGERAATGSAATTDADLAAWTLVANVLLNLDEAITKE